MATNSNRRVLALDILRGITIAGMILVNNPGSWGNIYAPLRHASWNGLTPTDLVFPFFMFIMGISTYFSLNRYNFRPSTQAIAKILIRTAVIFGIGLFIAWLSLTLRGINSDKTLAEAMFNFENIRILGVMPRLAISYGIAALIVIFIGRKNITQVIGVFLVIYAIILIAGCGYEFSENNILCKIDRAVLGENHMYTSSVDGTSLKFDPEGFMSTLPSIAHVLIGFICGQAIAMNANNARRMQWLFIFGTCFMFAGMLLSYGLPINKKIWSPTFVLTTCGMAASLLALLIWIIDVRGHRNWCRFFEVFGINPLFCYVCSTILAIVIGNIRVANGDGTIALKTWLYREVFTPVCCDNSTLASLAFAICFVGVNWLIGYFLYRKRIYIKI